MTIHKMEQRTPEWYQIRLGKFTASSDFQVCASGKPDTHKKLVYKKAAELITGCQADEHYTNASMERGIELEAEGLQAFEMATGLPIEKVGFITNSDSSGCSPDGLIYARDGVEMKCPDKHTHLGYLINGRGNLYQWQIQGSMWVTGFDTWYFVSYNADFPPETRLFIELVSRDEDKILKISNGVNVLTDDLKRVMVEYGGVKYQQ